MQGIIYNALAEFVETTAGMAVWNEAVESSHLLSEGAFTSGQTYPDEDAVTLAVFVANKLELELPDALRAFGKFLFGFLLDRVPLGVKEFKSTQDLLASLSGTIHAEVNRLHPDSYTPLIDYLPESESKGMIVYRSKRKLCAIAEGLILGAAEHYGQQVRMKHTRCMHDGAEDCRWIVAFS